MNKIKNTNSSFSFIILKQTLKGQFHYLIKIKTQIPKIYPIFPNFTKTGSWPLSLYKFITNCRKLKMTWNWCQMKIDIKIFPTTPYLLKTEFGWTPKLIAKFCFIRQNWQPDLCWFEKSQKFIENSKRPEINGKWI